jgi:hypothetical protein
MVEVAERPQTELHHLVALAAVHVDHERDTASIVLEAGVVKALGPNRRAQLSSLFLLKGTGQRWPVGRITVLGRRHGAAMTTLGVFDAPRRRKLRPRFGRMCTMRRRLILLLALALAGVAGSSLTPAHAATGIGKTGLYDDGCGHKQLWVNGQNLGPEYFVCIPPE